MTTTEAASVGWEVNEQESLLEPEFQQMIADGKIKKVFIHGVEDDNESLRFYLRVRAKNRCDYWLCTRRAPLYPRRFAQFKWMIRYLKAVDLYEVERTVLFDI